VLIILSSPVEVLAVAVMTEAVEVVLEVLGLALA
jgi:hypothetical protein